MTRNQDGRPEAAAMDAVVGGPTKTTGARPAAGPRGKPRKPRSRRTSASKGGSPRGGSSKGRAPKGDGTGAPRPPRRSAGSRGSRGSRGSGLPSATAGVLDAARARVSVLRREAAAERLLTFARTYLPGHFRLEPCPMHEEIAGLLEEGLRVRGLRLAIAAPRGHAKSTLVSLACVLWAICYERECFIQIISDTADQAADLLAGVKTELEVNPLLREDFPEACEEPGRPPGPERWKRTDIIARNRVRVLALGAEQKVRGRKHGADRPSLIILDDIENEALARSPDQREARWRWLTGSVLNAGSSATTIVVVGTVLHHDSVLARLLDPRRTQAWTTRRYQAVVSWATRKDLWQAWEGIASHMDEFQGRTGPEAARAYFQAHREAMLEEARALWPRLADYEALMVQRLAMGRVVFDAEKQNDPSDPEDAVFLESDLRYWDDQHKDAQGLLAALRAAGGSVSIYGACDPSLGRAGRHADDSAIVTLAKHGSTGKLYVLDADIRRRSPDQILEAIIEYDRIRRFTRFGIERVQFQEFLRTELERRSRARGRALSVKGIDQTVYKRGRIQSLQPLLASGTLLLSRRHTLLLEQLRRFPHAAHDDGPDALEMAVRTAKEPVVYFVPVANGLV